MGRGKEGVFGRKGLDAVGDGKDERKWGVKRRGVSEQGKETTRGGEVGKDREFKVY